MRESQTYHRKETWREECMECCDDYNITYCYNHSFFFNWKHSGSGEFANTMISYEQRNRFSRKHFVQVLLRIIDRPNSWGFMKQELLVK